MHKNCILFHLFSKITFISFKIRYIIILMKNREIATERVVSILTFAYVFVVLCMNFHLLSKGYISTSLIPYSDFVIVFAHSLVSIGTFVNIFKPNRKLQFAYFQLESVIAILSSYEILGIFLFYVSLGFLYLFYYDKENLKKVTIIVSIIHLSSLMMTFTRGYENFIIFIFATAFMCSIFIWFFEVIKIKYSCFAPESLSISSNITNLKIGNDLILSEFGLSERQINLVYDYITEKLTFKELSEKYLFSVSTVKLEFMQIYKILGVSKLEDLRMLLLQYVIKK